MVGVNRGLHIITSEEEFTAWKAIEVDEHHPYDRFDGLGYLLEPADRWE
jgi:hypothetical protein